MHEIYRQLSIHLNNLNNYLNYWASNTTQSQKNKQSNQIEMGRGYEKIFLQRRHKMANRREKMLNIAIHQGNANQNHNEVPPHSCQNGYYEKVNKVLARMWRKKNALHCWWDCKSAQPLWKTVWGFLQKLIELPYDPACLGISLKKTKTLL